MSASKGRRSPSTGLGTGSLGRISAVLATVLALAAAGSGASASPAAAAVPAAPAVAGAPSVAAAFGQDPLGTYRPITAYRVSSAPTLTGPGAVSVPLDGSGHSLPAAGGYSVVANVTITDVQQESYVTVFATGSTRPHTSNLNVHPGGAYATSVILPVGAKGSIDVYNDRGPVRVLVDVLGYYPNTSTFQAVTPVRLMDTRPGEPTVDGQLSGQGQVGGGVSVRVPVAGRGGLPAQGVAGVFATVTAVLPSSNTWVTAYPSGASVPLASNLNPGAGRTLANMAFIPLSADGAVSLSNALGNTHLLLDVVGFLKAGVATFHAFSPQRFLDTRQGQKTFDGQAQAQGRLGPGETRRVQVAGRAGIPATATSVVANVTAVAPTEPTFVSVGSSQQSGWFPQGVSTLNPDLNPPGVTSNLALVPLDIHGGLAVYNSQGVLDAIVDVVGWSDAAVHTGIFLAGRTPSGAFPNENSGAPRMSRDGSTVVYPTNATDIAGRTGLVSQNLVTGTATWLTSVPALDPPAVSDDGSVLAANLLDSPTAPDGNNIGVFLYDRTTGSWLTVVVDPDGQTVYRDPSISGDGRLVGYERVDDQLDASVSYLYDRRSGTTVPLVKDVSGAPLPSSSPQLSGDGRFVAFVSPVALVAGVTSGSHAYVLDRSTGQLATLGSEPVNVVVRTSSDGSTVLLQGDTATWVVNRTTRAQTTLASGTPRSDLSGDSRYACLTVGEASGQNLYRANVATGERVLVTLTSTGAPARLGSDACSISQDGSRLTFLSQAPDLVSGDTYSTDPKPGFSDVFGVDLPR